MEEGTMQLMASYMDVPTVIVDGFKYGSYGGVKDYKTETIQTKATAFCKLKDLKKTIENEMKNKHKRKDARRKVIMDEFGDPDSDPIENILQVASDLVRRNKEKISCQQNSQ